MDDELMAEDNGWSKYEKMVIEKLDDHDQKFTGIEDKLTQIQVDIALIISNVLICKITLSSSRSNSNYSIN